MKKYLVGGAVRDSLLKIPSNDRDFVVVGSTPEEMKNLGFSQVGNSFPVFLDPNNKEEYALARKDKKIAGGYNGFSFDFSPSVTLEEDLKRRDFTINAMALNEETNELIDPYNGQEDLKNRILRHVNDEAFADDPVRVFRAARFVARFNLTIAPETLKLMVTTVENEFKNLTPERIWKEFEKGVQYPNFWKMIKVLHDDVGCQNNLIPYSLTLYPWILKAEALQTSKTVLLYFLLRYFSDDDFKNKKIPNEVSSLVKSVKTLPNNYFSSEEAIIKFIIKNNLLKNPKKAKDVCDVFALLNSAKDDFIASCILVLQHVDYQKIKSESSEEDLVNNILTARIDAVKQLISFTKF
jgi:tRNA nucleotidyltransferase/poly(A) polymerase